MTTAPALSTQHLVPTRKLRLPAYGKALLAARRQGQHPRVVHVIYGEDEWRYYHPEFRPGVPLPPSMLKHCDGEGKR
jgi:hypothetical protein